jgi:transposase
MRPAGMSMGPMPGCMVWSDPHATAYVIDPTRSGAVAERILGLDYSGIMIHDGWSPYDRFHDAEHQQCFAHLLWRCDEILETATPGQ